MSVAIKKKLPVIGIIPARMAATRFPGKPMVKICGMPMIGHVYFRSKMSRLLDEVIVATCDKEIFDYIHSIGGKAVMTSHSHQRASDRAAEAMQKFEKTLGRRVGIAVMIQGDEPMLNPATLDAVVQPLIKKNLLIANLMTPLEASHHDDRNDVKVVVDKNQNALYFSRAPIPFSKNFSGELPIWKQIGIIAFQRDFLLKFLKLPHTPLEKIESVDMLRVLEHGYDLKMVPVFDKTYGVDIPGHVRLVERLLKKNVLSKKYLK
jgi:3-deoxy-manno-octulosonate cytidylyltransferase (CMP-KDO synthetase)